MVERRVINNLHTQILLRGGFWQISLTEREFTISHYSKKKMGAILKVQLHCKQKTQLD